MRVALLLVVVSVTAVLACNPSTPKEMPPLSASVAPSSVVSPSTSASTSTSTSTIRVLDAAQDSDAISLIRSRRLEARSEGRVLVVYVGASWCEPCKRFKAEIASGRLDQRLGKLTLLAFDADKDGDRLSAAGYSHRFIPFVALPGADGQPVDSQQATGKGGEAWRELLGKLDGWQRGDTAH